MNFPNATIIGYPRIGHNRELKKIEESYWDGQISLDELENKVHDLQFSTYNHLYNLGLDKDWSIPMSFSYYDQMLDAAITFGALPERFEHLRKSANTNYSLNMQDGHAKRNLNSFAERMRRPSGIDEINLDGYFTVARGDKNLGVEGLPGEMTKWFDTNYHYIVPEFHAQTRFSLANHEIIRQFTRAKEVGLNVRPVIVGPVTFLALGKYAQGTNHAVLVEPLIATYAKLITKLRLAGAKWIQFDEPAFVSQMHILSKSEILQVASQVYSELGLLRTSASERPNIFVSTPFEAIEPDILEELLKLPFEALHFDNVHGHIPSNLDLNGKQLVAGLINGRNIWRAKMSDVQTKFTQLRQLYGADNVSISTSCSLQHVPHSINGEFKLGIKFPELLSNLSFADEKVNEVVRVSQGYSTCGREPRTELIGRSVPEVHQRLETVSEQDFQREPISQRKLAQQQRLQLPLLPTTTIGSFPQTTEIRLARTKFKNGELTEQQYIEAMQQEIKSCVELQERIGLDVLVHGEAERNDMVQYFAENFEGFAVTENGWVQSYGSRCTKPSILWGDVFRKQPFTTQWITYAASLTNMPMKGMLTGPVTILAWSFVRDDQPLKQTAYQVALALRDEIEDLEQANISIIQVDEPALRELLPLKVNQQGNYLEWSVNAFKLATSSVRSDTQIHTHLCYSEFEVVLPAIIGLNADVTSIESARSKMEIVASLVQQKYPLGIGPGIYDIHSPRIPDVEEMVELLTYAVNQFKSGNLEMIDLWVNPDCGLKTRKTQEATDSLINMIKATQIVRSNLK